jgi:hypothetical protein
MAVTYIRDLWPWPMAVTYDRDLDPASRDLDDVKKPPEPAY